MGHVCHECGAIRPSEVSWGPLQGRDQPFEVYYNNRIVPFTRAEAVVAFEMVRHGRITRDRMYDLCPHAEEGVGYNVISVRIARIREKLKRAGAPVRIVSIFGIGYALEALGG